MPGSEPRTPPQMPPTRPARHESDERLRLFIAAVQDYAIFLLNPQGHVVSWNDGATHIKGYTADEILGQHFSRFYPPEDIACGKPAQALRIAAAQGRVEEEGWRLRKDGSRFWAHVVLTALHDERGQLHGFGKVAHDLTERWQQQEQFRIAVESAPTGMVMVDQVGTIVLVNAQVERLFGYSRQELIGQPVELLVPTHGRAHHPASRERFQAHPQARPMGAGRDLYGRRKDGSEVPVEIGLNPLETHQGVFVLASIVNITERKRAEERFRLVVEAAPNGMVMVDQVGLIVLVNSQVERLFGYNRQELIGQPLEVLVPERFRATHPAYRQAFYHTPQTRAMGHGRDLYGRRKDGSEVPVEIGLNPLETEGAMFVLASIVDITERKRAEEQFRLVVEAAPNGMVMVDQAGLIVLVNSQVERLFGYTREELLGQPIERLVPMRFREQHPAARAGFYRDPHSRPMGAGRDLYGRRKDGSEVPVEIGLNPLETERGLFVLASIVDITERKRAEEHMRGSLKEKETLLKEIHHRVKNNLQIISSLLSLQSNYIKSPESLAMFQDSQNRIKSMALVHEKLYQSSDLSRISMAEYLQDLVTQLQQAYGVRETIRFAVQAEAVFLSIDVAVPCALIAHELVVNAIKHAFPPPRSGAVCVTLTRDTPATCVLAIADTGIGLPPDLDIQHTDSLGLSLVTDLVDQLHATVALGQAQGTSWTITFPVKTEPERLYAINADSDCGR